MNITQMNITEEKIDELNALIKVELEPKDYEPKVEEVLKEHRKNAKMPGFRPGKVPFGMIRKMYGNAVKAEEINKILGESLYKYIEEHDMKILGNPLPKDDKKLEDFEKRDKFEFEFELGLAPKFDVSVSDKDKFTRYKIKVDDELINKQVEDLSRRYGKVTEMEESKENHLLFGEFVQLDKEGNELEGGIKKTATITIDQLKDEKVKNSLIGLKKGDIKVLNPKKVSRDETDLAKMLDISIEEAEKLEGDFRFEVQHIYHLIPAPLDQELFDKSYGKEAVKSEGEFRNKIKEELEKILDQESDRKLMKDISDRLMEKLNISLPDEFLKKWLVTANEKISKEEVEKDYKNYSEGLKWQLIVNKIQEKYNIKVSKEELLQHVSDVLKQEFARFGYADAGEEEIKQMAVRVLQKEEEAQKYHNQIIDKKLFDFFKETVTVKEKEVSYDEFIKLASGKSTKFNLMDKMSNLIKR